MLARRTLSALLVTSVLGFQVGLDPAWADNPMGYRLLPADQAANLPHNGGALGMSVGRAEQITNDGMTFDLLRVNGVSPGGAGGQAGFRTGDEIISVDGQVFPSVAAFAGYVGSIQPGRQVSVDYIPAGGGPQQAQRIDVTLGEAGRAAAPAQQMPAPAQGLTHGEKVAIGVGAVALFGCYKLGCFSRLKKRFGRTAPAQQQPVPVQ